MVGIPGRSKGCNTCRRRKIGCDATKPSCNRCIATGRKCDGYETYPVFMVWTNSGYAKRSRLDELKPRSESPLPTDATAGTLTSTPKSIPASPPPSEAWSAQITSLFFHSILSTNETFNNEVGVFWLREAYAISSPLPVLDHALKALATVRVSWQNQDQDLLLFAQKSYSKALHALKQAVQDPNQTCDDHTFIAARTMVMYETLISTTNDSTSWKSHLDGLAMLLKVRGPTPFATKCGRAAMEDVRDSIMIRTSMDRKSCFLGTHPWTDIPWTTSAKDNRQYVCDIGFRMGALLELADRSFPPFDGSPASQTLAISILGNVRDCLLQFDALNLENISATGDELEIPFKNMQSAVATIHCWGLHLYMRMLVPPLLGMLASVSDLEWNHPEAGELITFMQCRLGEAESRRTCRKIHAAARFLLRDDMKYVGSRRLTFPLLSANYFLWQIKAPELQECQKLSRQACEGSGVGIGRDIAKGISPKFASFGDRKKKTPES